MSKIVGINVNRHSIYLQVIVHFKCYFLRIAHRPKINADFWVVPDDINCSAELTEVNADKVFFLRSQHILTTSILAPHHYMVRTMH